MGANTVLQVGRHPLQGDDEPCTATATCEKCGATIHVGAWPFCPHPGGVGLVAEKTYPFTTRHFNGKPIEVTSRAHEKALMQEYGVRKRDDVAWLEKTFEGWNSRTGKYEYREGSGMGLPGVWI